MMHDKLLLFHQHAPCICLMTAFSFNKYSFIIGAIRNITAYLHQIFAKKNQAGRKLERTPLIKALL